MPTGARLDTEQRVHQKTGYGPLNTRKPDRRVSRTRSQLHDALLALVIERGYDAITVQDILNRANIGRSTFYLHFRDKDDLLLSGMDSLRESLRNIVVAAGHGSDNCLAFIPDFFEHAERYRDSYQALTGAARIVAEHIISGMLRELVSLDLKLHVRSSKPALPIDAVTRSITAAIMGVVAWWIEQKPPVAPAEASRVCLTLLLPALNASQASRATA